MSALAMDPYLVSERRNILSSIDFEECSLAVWRREVPVDVRNLLAGEPENLRISVPVHRAEPPLREALDSCRFPNTDEREELIQDIVSLCQSFGKISALTSVEIRLEVVTGNSCWKFHTDYVEMRLITTYLGRGTQWIENRDAGRLADGLEPKAVNELGTGDVGLFKGRRGIGRPAIHRSPPIQGTGEKRLLLVLNPTQD